MTEYENFYETDGAYVIETLKKIDEKLWIMESTAEHSLFNFYQKSVFYVENNRIYSTEMERRLRAFKRQISYTEILKTITLKN